MADAQIQPHRITKPFQLLAAWLTALVVLDGALLTAARFLTKPAWIPPLLAIAAVVFVPLFLGAVFLMQTVFRDQLQDDPYYSKWRSSQTKEFRGFRAENVTDGKASAQPAIKSAERLGQLGADAVLTAELDAIRVSRYQSYKGIFLVHTWRPSRQMGQVADVVLRLRQHAEGPLSAGQVGYVEYELGRKFFSAPVVKRNPDECFRLEVSAYSPMLCLARVHLKDGSSFELERYADFEETDELEAAVSENMRRWRKGGLLDVIRYAKPEN